MNRMITVTGVLLAIVCRSALAQEPRIEVTAQATTSVRPDQAEQHMTIMAVANDSEKALVEMKKRTEAAKAVIVKYEVKDGQIRRSEIEINANIADGGKKSGKEGYYAKVTLSFILLKLAQYEELAVKLSQLDGVELSKPHYGRTDADQLLKDTLKKALANAQAKAKFMADALAVKLGSPVYASETESHYGQYRQRRGVNMILNLGNEAADPFAAAAQQTSGDVSEGTDRLDNVLFESQVTVHFKIEK